KQPRVPEYRERDGVVRYLKTLILFLKDFCFDVWQTQTKTGKTLYPVGSVYATTSEKSPAAHIGGEWEQIHTDGEIIYWKRTA
ncbi:MAG: hypothetical protein Q4C03_07990, partial [bacterium]|nr:hypothetical protein [bacterium]